MKTSLQAFVVLALLAVCFCEDPAKESTKVERQDGDIVLIEMSADEENKPKRQTAEGRVVGGTQHFQYGASPGHYLLRTKEASPEPELAYLTLVKQYEVGHPAGQQQARPSQQQYVVQRQPQSEYTGQQQLFSREPKILQYQTDKRPVYQQPNQLVLQQVYQSQRPIALRPSQPVKAAPVQSYYTNQAYGDTAGQPLHEGRVQAALAVGEEKQAYAAPQHAIQYTNRPLQDNSFEKELAQLVAANQAVEYKARAQQQSQNRPQPQHQQAQAQAAYYQQYQIPYKQEFLLQPVKKQEYSFMRQAAQGATKYVSPTILARAKNPQPQQQQPLPQQYLIETTKPAAPQNKPVALNPRQQYTQSPTEEPKYFAYQTYPENVNAMKIVAAPQLQRIQPSPQPQYQYKQIAPKEPQQQNPPEYIQYYQSIKAQPEEPASDSKQYYRLAQAKAQPSSPSYAAQPQAQAEYADNYETQTRLEESAKYATYSAPKAQRPQQSHQLQQSQQPQQYSTEDDQLIQSLIAQSQQKSRQGLSGFATDKGINNQLKQKIPQLASASHSSIFVSKSLAPKKHSHSVTIEPSPTTEQEEEIATVRLPPPKNNKVYTQEEFQALVEAGYSVTPVPVRDDDDYQPSFSPAPVNYPGHSQYPAYPSGAPEPETKKPTESYAPATAAPRKRKQRRPAAARHQQQQYRYVQDTQAESESQDKETFASPSEETVLNYGTRKHSRVRGSAAHREVTDSES